MSQRMFLWASLAKRDASSSTLWTASWGGRGLSKVVGLRSSLLRLCRMKFGLSSSQLRLCQLGRTLNWHMTVTGAPSLQPSFGALRDLSDTFQTAFGDSWTTIGSSRTDTSAHFGPSFQAVGTECPAMGAVGCLVSKLFRT